MNITQNEYCISYSDVFASLHEHIYAYEIRACSISGLNKSKPLLVFAQRKRSNDSKKSCFDRKPSKRTPCIPVPNTRRRHHYYHRFHLSDERPVQQFDRAFIRSTTSQQ